MRFQGVILIFAVVIVMLGSGCGMKGRLYAVDRPRVDQANMGNAGYISGDKKDGQTMADRNTRRIYVFEFDKRKKLEAEQAAKSVEVSSGQAEPVTVTPAQEVVTPSKDRITIPYIGDDEPVTAQGPEGQSELTENGMMYTVLKDDTLQKISKKVYGSFGKWTKIYDANKDKIKNPNFVKPGTVLVIPPID